MVISWASPKAMPALAGAVVGVGGASGYLIGTPGADVAVRITRGHLTLDKGAGTRLRSGFAGRGWGQVMMHEILHALGLGHAQAAPTSCMYGTATSQNYRFGAGDITGMHEDRGRVPDASGCL